MIEESAFTMKRVVQASLCATLLWFGVMQMDSGLALQSRAAGAAGNVNDIRTVTYQYEARTLLSKPGGKPAQSAVPNDRYADNEGKEGAGESSGTASGTRNNEAGNSGGGARSAGGGVDRERETAIGGSANNASGTGDVGGGAWVTSGQDSGTGKSGEGNSNAGAQSSGGETKASDGSPGGQARNESGGAGKNVAAETKGTAGANATAGGQGGNPSDKVVYLTFDDGPSQYTAEVLSILKREGVPATFFLLGQQVERYPDMVKQIVSEGHAIGNHTYNHVYKELYGSFRNFADQIMRTDDAINKAAGIRTTLVRAPGGTYSNFDQGYFDGLKSAGYQVHDWNVDSGDSKRIGVPASEIIANVHGSKLANTLNVLMHDGTGHAETVKALPAIIAYYKKLGYTFATLNEQVEPMQFKLASQTKWSRGKVTEADKTTLVQFASKLDRTRSIAMAPKSDPVLVIHRGDQTLELQPTEYKLLNGSIRVPLDKLSDWLGGTAELDEKEGVVAVSFEGRQWFWLMDSWPPAAGEEAKLDVPIRATLAQFGMEIESYVYTKEQREVWIGA